MVIESAALFYWEVVSGDHTVGSAGLVTASRRFQWAKLENTRCLCSFFLGGNSLGVMFQHPNQIRD